MNEAEARDLTAAKTRVAEIKYSAFEYMRHLIENVSPSEIKHYGYPTLEAACLGRTKTAIAEIEKVWAAFLKKYPDQRSSS